MPVRYDLSTEQGRKTLLEVAGQLILSGKRPVVEIVKDSKSSRQRRYQWGWFYRQAALALKEAGISIPMEDGSRYPYDSEILHEILKEHVLRPLYREWGKRESIKAAGGRELKLSVSTEKDCDGKVITLAEFSEFIRACRSWLWERWEIAVPEPEDGDYAEFAAEMRSAEEKRRAAA